jgi:hypothetical protein
MSKIKLLPAVVLALGLAVLSGSASVRAMEKETAPTNLQVLVDAMRANRKALIAVNLGLSDDEASKFWPLYDRYQKDISAIGDRIEAVVEDYIANFRNLSNEKALKLIEDYLAAEADRLKVRRDYLPEFAQILPGRTVARFYQLENKMDAVLRYELASTIPVVEEPEAAPAK